MHNISHIFGGIAVFSWTVLSAPAPDWSVLNRADTLGLYIKETRVGWMTHSFVVDADGKAIREVTQIHAVNIQPGTGGRGDSLDMAEYRTYGFDGLLRSARQELRSAAGETTWDLSKATGTWGITVNSGGRALTNSAGTVPDRINAVLAVYQGIRNRSLKTGDAWTDTTTDLTSGTPVQTSVKCVGVPADGGDTVWRFLTRDSMTKTDAQWVVDRSGRTLVQETPPFVARRENAGEKTAPQNGRRSISDMLAVPVAREPLPGDAVRLLLDTPDLLDSTVRQFYRKDGNAWVLLEQNRRCSERYTGKAPAGFLAATSTMQSDDPRIINLAKSIAPGVSGPCAVIDAMNAWVYIRLKKRNTATFSNALEALDAGFGDCGEHAVLLGALLRARGVPARVVLGLVYVPSTQSMGYHAWIMVPQGKGWIMADPAFGQFPARHALLPLIIDDTGKNASFMAGLIGKIKVDINGQ